MKSQGIIRPYKDSDYATLKELYQHTEWYGGVFDEARDGKERLSGRIKSDPQSILVYERDGQIVGSVSLVDDGRMAMLFRFAVKFNNPKITKELYDYSMQIFKDRGHTQVLVYTLIYDKALHKRYHNLGMHRGGDYTCYWIDVSS